MDYSQINPPPRLLGNIMAAIAEERARLRAIRRFAAASVLCIGAFAMSGFGHYLSLLFIDARLVLANWHDFAMSLLESFPALGAAGLLAGIAAVLMSFRSVFTNAKKILPHSHVGMAARHT
jgi:hypothetical protein